MSVTNSVPQSAIRSRVVHPVLFALLPVLLMYAGNIGELRLHDLFLPVLLVLALSLPVWWLGVLLTRDRYRGAVLTSLFWIWCFAYGPWQRWLAPEVGFLESMTLLLYAVLLFAVGAGLVLLRRDVRHVSNAMNLIAVCLVALQIITISRYELARPRSQPSSAKSNVTTPVRIAPAEAPNIFFIVLDGYARTDVMKKLYHFDNTAFLDFLRRKGFQVAAHSRANYCQTYLSLSSCLNFVYLDEVVKRVGAKCTDRQALIQYLINNRTVAFLREQGYDIVAYPSGYEGTEWSEAAAFPAAHHWGELSEFQSALLKNTPLSSLLRARLNVTIDADHVRARSALYTFDHLAAEAKRTRPAFIFAHIVSPHPPFIFRRDGSIIEKLKYTGLGEGTYFSGTREEYLTAYRDQAEFITRRTQTMIEDLLKNATRPTAIVLMSDHGPGSSVNWMHPELSNLPERFSTLVAVRLPEGNTARLDDHTTTVNVMRFVLSQCLEADLPPLPSVSYFSDCQYPYLFTRVTDEQGKLRWPK